MAANQVRRDSLVLSKRVPEVTDKRYWHPLQSNWSRVLISETEQSPHRGQHTPVGQRSFSRYSLQESSLWKRSSSATRLSGRLESGMGHERRKKDRLPKDVTKLTDEEVMERVFSKRVCEEIKKEVEKADQVEPKSK